MKKCTREWVRKADADYKAAKRLASGAEPLHDQVCFHCQQSAEKYLKAVLEENGQYIPKTHELDKLMELLRPRYPMLAALRRGLLFLSDFAVDTRYPGHATTKRQAGAAMRWAGRMRQACRTLLGIRPERHQRGRSP